MNEKLNSKKVIIIIERRDDAFSAFAENVPGIYGMGETVEQAKQEAFKGIELLMKYNKPENIPTILKGPYETVFKFDAESFLS